MLFSLFIDITRFYSPANPETRVQCPAAVRRAAAELDGELKLQERTPRVYVQNAYSLEISNF